MSRTKHIRWLLKELPELSGKGLLTTNDTDRLRAHYQQELDAQHVPNTAFLLIGILGSLLIGTGIISIFAYNWDEFSRFTRTVLSLLPLLLAIGIYSYAFFYRPDSLAWREGTAGLLCLMIVASISLISQTYHISGLTSDLLFTWMLLSIPLMYLTHASLVCLIYLAGITAWALEGGNFTGQAVYYWLLLGFALPHIARNLRADTVSSRGVLLGWALSLSLVVALPGALEARVAEHLLIGYALLFCLLYVLGKWVFIEGGSLWVRPFQTTGITGLLVLSIVLAYRWGFELSAAGEIWQGERYLPWTTYVNLAVMGGMLAGIAGLSSWLWRRGTWLNPFVLAAPLLVATGLLLAHYGAAWAGTVIFNLFLLGWGIFYLRAGLRTDNLSLINAGMFFLSALLVLRFFDSKLSFLLKGIVFVLVGIGFLAVNYYLSRKHKSHG